MKSTSQKIRERAKRAPLPHGATIVELGVLVMSAILLLHVFSTNANAEALSEATQQKADSYEMILISGGEFVMGNDGAYADESPRHIIRMSSFYLDAHEVTNAEFKEFVTATGYVTQAERDGHSWAYFDGEIEWQYAAGTDWQHPQGPTSSIENKMKHPVVCVSWEDAAAYARWAGKRLPTEAEWEYAARAGFSGHFIANTGSNSLDHSHHMAHTTPTASDQSPSSKSHAGSTSQAQESIVMANVWDGHWPEHNEMSDGFYYTAPVESFAPNAWGVYDMLGNVWEWTADWYDSTYYSHSPETNPDGPRSGEKRVARGGSWFCSPNYCGAYSSHYRGASPPDHAFNNVGFRCAMDVPNNDK